MTTTCFSFKPASLRPSARKRIAKCPCAAPEVTLLDYGAGNVRSVRNALKHLGCVVKEVNSHEDILNAKKLLFPGVGCYGQAMDVLVSKGYVEPLKEYIQADRPYLGICLGLHLLFEGGDENGGVEGLGIIPGRVQHFSPSLSLPVPHIGWNTLRQRRPSRLLSSLAADDRLYFVHSFRALPEASSGAEEWVLATSEYGEEFTSVVNKGNVYASQFHPEKSGPSGLGIIRNFVNLESVNTPDSVPQPAEGFQGGLARRVVACLDVRANDAGDLVVTKGDQYDVREKAGSGDVRNLGKPVSLCSDYYKAGADEVTFLNITAFRDLPLEDLPMLEVLREASEGVFVPLTVGGGIRGLTDASGHTYSALEVAGEYFRSGADKVSIGSDAVEAALAFRASGGAKTGETSIEQISEHYGRQAVVISATPPLLLRPRALFLDACGTFLIPSEPVATVYQRYAVPHGVSRHPDLILRDFRRAYNAAPAVAGEGGVPLRYRGDAEDFWREVVFAALDTQNEEVFREIYEYYTRPEAWRVPPGFTDAIARIRALGVKVAVVSNFDGRLRTILNVLGLEDCFDAVVISCEVGAEKPSPVIFDAACRAVGVSPGAGDFVIHIGDDRRNDVWGARGCGITAWLWGADVKSFDEIADRLVTGYTAI